VYQGRESEFQDEKEVGDKVMENKYMIELIVGDWSGDGHNQSEKFCIESSVDKDTLNLAYKKGVKAIGIDITSFCEEYEDNKIPKDVFNQFLELKFFEGEKYKNEDDNDVWTEVDTFVDIWLGTVRIGDPSITVQLVKLEGSIDIGGYGLFS